MMKYFLYAVLFLLISTAALGGSGTSVIYEVNGQSYEGYYISPSDKAPFALLIHDWDGLTDYEIKRAHMLSDLGYAVLQRQTIIAVSDVRGSGYGPENWR